MSFISSNYQQSINALTLRSTTKRAAPRKRATIFHLSPQTKTKPEKTNVGLGQVFKEILTPKRLSIIAAVFFISHFVGTSIRKALVMDNSNNNRIQGQGPHNSDQLIKEASINFIQLLISSLMAFTLENLFINRSFNLKNAFREATSNDSLKLAFSLSAFNSVVETAGHYLQIQQTSSKNQKLIELGSSLIQMFGSFALARLIAGAHSIAAIIASSCKCCGLPLCGVELFNILNSMLKLVTGLFQSQTSPKTKSLEQNNSQTASLNATS
ncbi:MAG: hypothetical protein SFU25_02175 [Candidatus Caenarcaniphilales bacterium]|nr:hypothetical protein [Candidatus Caenarcaniphilales bacterium]